MNRLLNFAVWLVLASALVVERARKRRKQGEASE